LPHIAFLLGAPELARNDNHRRLPQAFAAAGWQVTGVPQGAVRLTPGGVRLGDHDPARFDLVWLLGLGRPETFFDRAQLLRLLPQHRFVTRIDALVYLHAKYAWWPYMPETHAGNDPQRLKALLRQGGVWVAKPAAGSYGRDVHRISSGADGEAVIDALVGHAAEPGRYCLLQRYVAEIEAGEKRTLMAGGRLLDTYLRLPGEDFRTNLAAGARAQLTTLTAPEHRLVTKIAELLTGHGVGFAAIDICFPYLMEVNIANPGGLETLARLTGEDPTPAAVAAVIAAQTAQ
jgi:glutathione synthase